MIDELLKKSEGAEVRKYEAGSLIFSSGEMPFYYLYLSNGKVKLFSKEGQTKELIHEIIDKEQGIAEFSLFTDEVYPVFAVAISECEIIQIPKDNFLSLLNKHSDIGFSLIRNLSKSLHSKLMTSDLYFKQNSSDKVIAVLEFLKRNEPNKKQFSFQVLLTRKEIAHLTGLRVETVIRTIKKMEKQKLLKIIDRKIFY